MNINPGDKISFEINDDYWGDAVRFTVTVAFVNNRFVLGWVDSMWVTVKFTQMHNLKFLAKV